MQNNPAPSPQSNPHSIWNCNRAIASRLEICQAPSGAVHHKPSELEPRALRHRGKMNIGCLLSQFKIMLKVVIISQKSGPPSHPKFLNPPKRSELNVFLCLVSEAGCSNTRCCSLRDKFVFNALFLKVQVVPNKTYFLLRIWLPLKFERPFIFKSRATKNSSMELPVI